MLNCQVNNNLKSCEPLPRTMFHLSCVWTDMSQWTSGIGQDKSSIRDAGRLCPLYYQSMIAPYLRNVCTVLCFTYDCNILTIFLGRATWLTNFRQITSSISINRQRQPVPSPPWCMICISERGIPVSTCITTPWFLVVSFGMFSHLHMHQRVLGQCVCEWLALRGAYWICWATTALVEVLLHGPNMGLVGFDK